VAELAQTVYAQALFDAAMEAGSLTEIQDELKALEKVFRQTPVFLEMLSSPALTPDEKKDVLQKTLEGKTSPYLYNFMRILSDKGRTPLFFKIAEAFYDLCRRQDGILLVTAASAIPLTADQQARLSGRLAAVTGKKIQLQNTVDPSLLGGIVLRYDGNEIDGSVRERLSGLRRRLQGVIA